jgi:hypothetical protein
MVTTDVRLAPTLTPHGRLLLAASDDAAALDPAVTLRLETAFARGTGHGLLQLGAGEVETALPPQLGYWRKLAARYVTEICAQANTLSQDGARWTALPPPPDADLVAMAQAAPLMTGAEYLDAGVLQALWTEIDAAFAAELRASGTPLPDFLKLRHPAWNVVGRVHFNLAENRGGGPETETSPFAFLATYTTRLSGQGKAQHQPLGQALREYAGASNKDRLLSLLLPVQRAAESCVWLKEMVDTGEVFHPLHWTPEDALAFLHDVPKLEHAGVIVRMPAVWRASRPPRPKISASVGGKPPSHLGGDALLDFQMAITLDGEPLTAAEIEQLLAGTQGLALIRGRWVEIDRDRLAQTLEHFQKVEREVADKGLSFAEAMRLVAGADIAPVGDARADADWSQVSAGPWLAEVLAGLRSPEGLAQVDPGAGLRGTLRPYQQVGVRWLYLLAELGLGACLADDMGLGKTIQLLSLLLLRKQKRTNGGARRPSLLVAPASLLANWMGEIERFAPSLNAVVAHPSAMNAAELKALSPAQVADADLVITTYGTVVRVPWLAATTWDLVVLDEAQTIKNPGARQTRAVKLLQARSRFALTGTPVENRLGDLWSIFDFTNPGLLGTAKEFSAYARQLAKRQEDADDTRPGAGAYGPLRELVRPYILRRLKTDRSIITDLPEKTEMQAFCQLSRPQAALYQQAVTEFARELAKSRAKGGASKSDDKSEGVQRRGIVLSFLMRFKQICNHPSQWLGDASFAEEASGKWQKLREIAEVIASRQEKMLLFSQFREITAPVAAFLTSVFGRPGLVLHGGTDVRQRKELVRQFQEDETVPFFVLSLKAGGSGLNLTAASHVVHFDRWWNPAVENQATDRAFRIGQRKNVVVHKFVCRGTVEEKIDDLIESKRQLSKDLLEGGAELALTELKDDELLRLVALDLKAATKDL